MPHVATDGKLQLPHTAKLRPSCIQCSHDLNSVADMTEKQQNLQKQRGHFFQKLNRNKKQFKHDRERQKALE